MHDKAIEAYTLAIDLNPEFYQAYLNLGSLLARLGRIREATMFYSKALKIKPDYAEAHFNLGNMFLDRSELDRAVECYERALLIRPEFSGALCNLGVAHGYSGQFIEAHRYLELAVRSDASDPKAHYNVGVSCLLLGMQERAREVCMYLETLDMNLSTRLAGMLENPSSLMDFKAQFSTSPNRTDEFEP